MPVKKNNKKPARKAKNNNNKNKKKPNKTMPNVQRPVGVQEISKVCGLTDPFCPHARGARYYDANGTHSLAYPQRRMFPLATDSSGNLCFLLLPNYHNHFSHFGVVTAGNCVYSGTMTAAPVLGSVANYRIVTWGFTIKHVTTPLSASGLISIRGFGASSGVSYEHIDGQTMNADVRTDVPLQDCKNLAVIGKKANNTSSFYANPNTTAVTGSTIANYVSPGWDGYQVYVTGAPASTTIAYVELFINFEIVLDDYTGMAQLMTPPPHASPILQAASSAVTSTAESVFVSGINAASSYIKRSATTALASYFGGPAAGRAALLLS